jgi:1,4-dihydroxy-2-naphthoyl-CoA hydrolase
MTLTIPATLTLEQINASVKNTLMETLEIRYTDFGDDFLSGEMPVNPRVHQPTGRLHGGASLALAETLASTASALMVDLSKELVFGLEINANHIRGVTEGMVYGTARVVHLGKKTHVWEVKITDAEDKLVCISRITNIVVERNA